MRDQLSFLLTANFSIVWERELGLGYVRSWESIPLPMFTPYLRVQCWQSVPAGNWGKVAEYRSSKKGTQYEGWPQVPNSKESILTSPLKIILEECFLLRKNA
jgi:hypothetical protein